MEFKITGRHIDVTPAIREYAQKIERLHRYFDRIQSIECILEKRDNSHLFEVELIVDVEHFHAMVAKDKHEDLYAAIDRVTDKMERQLTDHKERLRNRKHIA
jgi:putative sigma-54 modulation protein